VLSPRSRARQDTSELHQKFHGDFVTDRPCTEAVASRRALLRALGASAATALLGGCASLAAVGSRFDASRISVAPTVLVATTRKAVNGGRAKPWYGAERGPLSLARAKLMSPSDERFSFSAIGMGDWALESVAPIRGQPGDLIAQAQVRDILVYIHGFRNTFEESVLDTVRLSDGISFSGETMAFSWPSKAGLFDYSYDRESAMWSRDGFERVLDGVMLSPMRNRLHLVAHSMGTMLTLEALRQIYARYGDAAAEKFGAIVFASPDIDIDIFTSSIERLGPLARKITIVTATNDRALALSRKLAGGITRVGAAEKAQLERLGLNVIDASDSWGIINHDSFLTNDEVRKVIRSAIERSGRRA
jgi:esterase/lipase superfamily enzyme